MLSPAHICALAFEVISDKPNLGALLDRLWAIVGRSLDGRWTLVVIF